MRSASGTKLIKFQTVRIVSFIFGCGIVSFFAISAGQGYFHTHQTALLFLALTMKFNLPQIISNVNIKAAALKNDF